jgi:hypothetical protein
VDGGPTRTGPSVVGTVTVNPAMTTGQIPPGFIGLSYEKTHLTDSFFTASNAPLIALFKLLGPSVVRMGGKTVDFLQWQASAPPTDAAATIGNTVGTADVDNLRDFLAATGWTTIYGVQLKNWTPAGAVADATYAAKTLGASLYGFELGDEPNFYYSPAQLYATFSAEANAIRANVPGARFNGPDFAWLPGTPEFAAAEATTISQLTVNHYIGPPGNMTTMLHVDTGLTSFFSTMNTAVSSNRIAYGWRMLETNTFYNHGSAGVSDAFGSALWVLDYAFQCAQGGAAGLNFHGGGAGQDGPAPFIYTPIAESNGVVTGAQPIFYGMLMFTLAGTGTVLQTTVTTPKVLENDASTTSALNFTAYAVGLRDGTMRVVLVNKDATYTVHANVNVGVTANSASALYLEAPSLGALTGVTLGGAPITPAGSWSPGAPIAVATSGQVVTIDVPPASAALVEVR